MPFHTPLLKVCSAELHGGWPYDPMSTSVQPPKLCMSTLYRFSNNTDMILRLSRTFHLHYSHGLVPVSSDPPQTMSLESEPVNPLQLSQTVSHSDSDV